jgi:Rrf2 family protein
MVALARTRTDEPLSARAIAADQGIPPAFLPQVMADLVRASLVIPTAGRTGGYRLARPAADISILDVVIATDGPDRDGGCILRNAACLAGGECSAHAVVEDARAAVREHLRSSSLAKLAEA